MPCIETSHGFPTVWKRFLAFVERILNDYVQDDSGSEREVCGFPKGGREARSADPLRRAIRNDSPFGMDFRLGSAQRSQRKHWVPSLPKGPYSPPWALTSPLGLGAPLALWVPTVPRARSRQRRRRASAREILHVHNFRQAKGSRNDPSEYRFRQTRGPRNELRSTIALSTLTGTIRKGLLEQAQNPRRDASNAQNHRQTPQSCLSDTLKRL